jgi:transposase
MSPAPGPTPFSTEVVAKPERRVCKDKKRILAQADAAKQKGDIAKLLRREGIYSSTLTHWRRQRATALQQAFSQKRGPEPKQNPLTGEMEKLRRQNQRLTEQLRKAEVIIEVQKKLAMLLGDPLALIPTDES